MEKSRTPLSCRLFERSLCNANLSLSQAASHFYFHLGIYSGIKRVLFNCFFRLTPGEGEWRPLLLPPARRFLNLFLNQNHNAVLFKQSLIERFVHELDSWSDQQLENSENQASFASVQNLVRFEMKNQFALDPGAHFEFLIQIREAGGKADVLVRSGEMRA